VVIRRTFTVTAIKHFTTFITTLKIVYSQIQRQSLSSHLIVLDTVISSIRTHFSITAFKYYTK